MATGFDWREVVVPYRSSGILLSDGDLRVVRVAEGVGLAPRRARTLERLRDLLLLALVAIHAVSSSAIAQI